MEASPGSGSSSDDALRRLEQRLDRASEAAERLIAEAAEAARGRRPEGPEASASPGASASTEAGTGESAGPTETPPAGWQVPGAGTANEGRGELELLAQVLRAVRELIPPELEKRLLDALRELLMALRALIDWYLERSEARRAAPVEVEDIPIS